MGLELFTGEDKFIVCLNSAFLNLSLSLLLQLKKFPLLAGKQLLSFQSSLLKFKCLVSSVRNLLAVAQVQQFNCV